MKTSDNSVCCQISQIKRNPSVILSLAEMIGKQQSTTVALGISEKVKNFLIFKKMEMKNSNIIE